MLGLASQKNIDRLQAEVDSISSDYGELKKQYDDALDLIRTPIPYTGTNEYYFQKYRRNGFLQTIINDPADRMTREGFELELITNNDTLRNAANEALKVDYETWDLINKRRDMIQWSRLYAEGSGILPVLEGSTETATNMKLNDLSVEIPKTISTIEEFNVLSDPEDFTINVNNQSNLKRADYNKRTYMIMGDKVHPSRIISYINKFRAKDRTGISVVDYTVNGLDGQQAALAGATTILERLGAILFKSSAVTLEQNTKAKIAALLTAIKDRLKSTGILGLKQNDEAQLLSYSFSGIKDVLNFIIDNLAGLSQVPKPILLGESTSGIITGDGASAVLLQYYDKLASMQRNDLAKADRYLIDLFMRTKSSALYGVLKGRKLPFKINYNPIWSMSEKEESETREKNAKADKIDFETGKSTPEELRELDDRYHGELSMANGEEDEPLEDDFEDNGGDNE